MNILVVDDELMSLRGIERTILSVIPDCEIHCFDRPISAVAHASKNRIDIAFLDIQMCDMNGIQLAKCLAEIDSSINIVFVTAYTEYASDSYAIPASDYLMKPVTAEAIEKALLKLRNPVTKRDTRMRVQCFGNFDIYMGSSVPIHFPRSKSKELFAYLVHRRGGSCTIEELVTVLNEGKEFDRSMNRQIQTMISAMRKALRDSGAEHVLIKQYNSLAIDPEQMDCDYYRFMDQDISAIKSYKFTGEYMSNYSWAEMTRGLLDKASD
jgi:two-component SAPR family response regulator